MLWGLTSDSGILLSVCSGFYVVLFCFAWANVDSGWWLRSGGLVWWSIVILYTGFDGKWISPGQYLVDVSYVHCDFIRFRLSQKTSENCQREDVERMWSTGF